MLMFCFKLSFVWTRLYTVKGADSCRHFLPTENRVSNGISFPLFLGSKCSFWGIPSSAEEPFPKLRTKRNGIQRKNLVLRNSLNTNKITFNQGDGNQFLRPLQEFSIWILSEAAAAAFCWVVFSFVEWFGMEFREFACISVLRNGFPSCFLLHCRIRKGIQRVCF